MNKFWKRLGASSFIAASAIASGTPLALAADSATIGDDLEVEKVPILGGSDTDLMSTVGTIVNTILIIVGVLAVFYLVWGGVMYVTSGGDSEKAAKGRTAITNAIIGIVIIMVSLLLYNYVIKGVRGS